MTQDNRLWVLMSRRLSGEATPADADELKLLLEHSPEKDYLLGILQSWFNDHTDTLSIPSAENPGLEAKFQRIIDQPDQDMDIESFGEDEPRGFIADFSLPEGSDRRRIGKLTAYAASAAAIILLSWAGWHWLSKPAPARDLRSLHNEEVLARPGARTKLVLPDGTQVWLNSSSRLRYNNDFNVSNREVALEGEAYFDVAKDPVHPFIVHASALDIKVLGTSFTIKSYPQDPTVEATLLRGLIEISSKDNPNTSRFLLKPNEKLVFSKHTLLAGHAGSATDFASRNPVPATADIAVNSIRQDIPDSNKVETAWMYNRLVFQGDNFKELTEKMERWYNVKIVIRDSSLINYHFGGAFASESVEEAFKALQLTNAFMYKINGNEIEIYAQR